MSGEDALQQARALLDELHEAAQNGAIIPVRLPGQIDAIRQLLDAAAQADDATPAQPAPGSAAADPQDEAQFVSIAVHELRTPMTSIRGYADMLGSMGELSDMQRQFLDTIRTNARRMEGLLTDVSFVNKIRFQTLNLSRKMDMYKNIAMMVEKATRPTADELGRDLIFETPSGLPLLETDGEMLATALTKLIENGLRYQADDGGSVTVTGAADGSDLLIHIDDTGIGMTPAEIARLGTLYYRGDDDVVLRFKGSGLGVPVAYGIIQMLGGSVTVSSQRGQGTRFTVRLPGMV